MVIGTKISMFNLGMVFTIKIMNFKHRENVNKILDDIKKITDNDAELNYITDLVRAIELLQEQITDLENEKANKERDDDYYG